MKKIIYSAFLLGILGVSCKKSSNSDDNSNNPPAGTSYITNTPGTTWHYNDHDNYTNKDTTSTLVSSSKDTLVNGKSFHVYFNTVDITNEKDTEYNCKVGNDYYQMGALTTAFPVFELKYLSDNQAVNYSWVTPFSNSNNGTVINAQIKNTIEAKGLTLTVGAKTYTDVIQVKTEIQNASISLTSPVAQTITPAITQDVHMYYAPKYGLIKSDVKLKIIATVIVLQLPSPLPPVTQDFTVSDVNSTTTLTSSTIQ